MLRFLQIYPLHTGTVSCSYPASWCSQYRKLIVLWFISKLFSKCTDYIGSGNHLVLAMNSEGIRKKWSWLILRHYCSIFPRESPVSTFHFRDKVRAQNSVHAIYGWKQELNRETWGSHGGKNVNVGLLGRNAMWICKQIPTFRKNLLSLPSVLKATVCLSETLVSATNRYVIRIVEMYITWICCCCFAHEYYCTTYIHSNYIQLENGFSEASSRCNRVTCEGVVGHTTSF
jgi:hypothetical protein